MLHPVIDLDIPETVGGLMNVQTMRQINAVLQAQTCPFYRGALDGLDIDNVAREEEWTKIPLLNLDDLRALGQADFMEHFCVAPRAEVAEYWQAGDLFYPRTQRDLTYALIGAKRALALAGMTGEDTALVSMPFGVAAAGQVMARAGSDSDIAMIWGGARDAVPPRAQLDLMGALAPSAWIGDADYGIQLGHLAEGARRDLPGAGVQRMLTQGAPMSDLKRRRLAQLWGAEVRDCWTLPEMMTLGCEDSDCYGFRLWSDYCYAEILDENTLEPVGEGQPGLLVLSALVTNNATPFLRWNTGQIATLRSRRGLGSPFDVFPLIQPHVPPRGAVWQGKAVDLDKLEGALLGAQEVVDYLITIDEGRFEIDVALLPGAERTVISKRIAEKIYQAIQMNVDVTVRAAKDIAQMVEEAGDDLRVRTLV